MTFYFFKILIISRTFFDYRYLKKQFQNADKNKNGSLTFDECLGLTEQLNIQMDKDRLVELFQVFICPKFREHLWPLQNLSLYIQKIMYLIRLL